MIDVQLVLPTFFSLFGEVGGRLLQAAAEKNVEGWFEKGLERACALGKKCALDGGDGAGLGRLARGGPQ